MGAILQSEPPALRTLQPHAPAALEHLVNVCFAKDPDARWSSARDIVLLLRGVEKQGADAATAPSRQRGGGWLPWTVAAAALVIAAALGVQHYMRPEPTVNVRHLAISPPPGATLELGSAPPMSPDGTRIAFVARDSSGQSRLYVRAFDAVAAEALPETEGATQPFWSPDSRSLGFFAGGQLKTIAIDGGRPRTLATAPVPRGGTWNQEGLILYVPSPPGRAYRVSSTGSDAIEVDTVAPASCWFPSFLPDGRRFVCTSLNPGRRTDRIYVASLGSTNTTPLVSTSAAGAVVAANHLFYRRERELIAQRLNPETFELIGAPVAIAADVAADPLTYQALFSASSDATVAYFAARSGSRLVWYDRDGKELRAVGARANYNSLCLSADERRIFVDQAEPSSGEVDIWTLDAAGGAASRLTFDSAVDFYPVCSPDGREIVFASLRRGRPAFYHLQTSAPGSEKMLLSPPVAVVPLQWTVDGRVVYRALHPNTNWDIWVLPMSGDRQPFPAVATAHDERFARLSDDGKWMAYASNQTGSYEIYVQPFPAGGATWQVSRGGGVEPQWRADGKELFYLSPDKKLMSVDVTIKGAELHFGVPRVLFSTHATTWESLGNQYVAAPNGKRFLVNRLPDDAAATPVAVILNSTAGRER
jgi:Tol biopolymer transport system component